MRGRNITPAERDRILDLVRQYPPISYERIGKIVGRHKQTVAGIAAANDVRRAGK